jgi:hypothetical protein
LKRSAGGVSTRLDHDSYYAGPHFHGTTSEACDAAETIAFHFMRAFSVGCQQMTHYRISRFLRFGKIGILLTVKR